jgi:hypothetical protein
MSEPQHRGIWSLRSQLLVGILLPVIACIALNMLWSYRASLQALHTGWLPATRGLAELDAALAPLAVEAGSPFAPPSAPEGGATVASSRGPPPPFPPPGPPSVSPDGPASGPFGSMTGRSSGAWLMHCVVPLVATVQT